MSSSKRSGGETESSAWLDKLNRPALHDTVISVNKSRSCSRRFSASNFSTENGSPTRFNSSRSTTRGFVCSKPSSRIEETTVPSGQAPTSAKANPEKNAVTAHVKRHRFKKLNTNTNIEKLASLKKRRPRKGRVQGGDRAAFATPSRVPSRINHLFFYIFFRKEKRFLC